MVASPVHLPRGRQRLDRLLATVKRRVRSARASAPAARTVLRGAAQPRHAAAATRAPARRAGRAPPFRACALDAPPREPLPFSARVLLAHVPPLRFRGDRSRLLPKTREPLPNFTRVEVFGSPN